MTTAYPKTLAAFRKLLAGAEIHDWQEASIVETDCPDRSLVRVIWLASDQGRLAYVEEFGGRLLLVLRYRVGARAWLNDYWFDLDRLHENWPAWTWHQQIDGKGWERPEHFALLDRLCELIPPPNAITQPRPRTPALANHLGDER
jgi:hypothetical protein